MNADKEKEKTIDLTEEEFRRYLNMIKNLSIELQSLKVEGANIKKNLLKEIDKKKRKKVLLFIQKIAD